MDTITLRRSGDAPLRFSGIELARQSSRAARGNRQNRWHELALYRSADGALVAHVRYETQWQGESPRDDVFVCADLAALRTALADYDPAGDVPDYGRDAAKHARVLDDLRRGYDESVSDLLADAGLIDDVDPTETLRGDRDLRRYRRLLADALAAVELTEGEASLICDALNGHDMLGLGDDHDYDAAGFWRQDVADSIAQDRADQRFGVDGAALLAKLAALDRVQMLAIADAAERWWRLDDDRSTRDTLAAVGLVR